MTFKTENRKISNIFEGQKVYHVPRYQRKYVWMKTNWSEILADIKFTINGKDSDICWSHFLGTIVLNKKPSSHKLGIEEYEIIDGQQRLTTIFIIFISMCARLYEIGNEESRKTADNILSTYIFLTKLDGKKEYKFVNSSLKDTIDLLIQAAKDPNSISLEQQNKNILKLYKYFSNEFKEYTLNEINSFLNKMLSINVVEIISEEDEEIYNIFEVLNARGQKLKQLELLKNRVMKYIVPRKEDIIDKAKRKWENIENNFSDLHDSDIALHHFAKCYIKKSAENKDSVYKLIKEEVEINQINDLLDSLLIFSKSYKIVTDRRIDNRYIRYFDLKRNQQVRTLLAALHNKLIIEYNDNYLFENSLKQIRNFFFVYNLTKQTSNKIEKIITTYSYKIFNSKFLAETKIYMADLFYKLYKFIDINQEIREYFNTSQMIMYSNKKDSDWTRNGPMVKYILSEVYRETQNDTEIVESDLTIEHIYSDNGKEETSRISNLTLVSRPLNEKLGNKHYKEKIKILKGESSITENQKLDSFIKEDKFNLSDRMDWFVKRIFDGNFKYDPCFLNIRLEEIEKYNSYAETLKDHDNLMELLKESGKNYKKRIDNDPTLSKEKDLFYKLLLIDE